MKNLAIAILISFAVVTVFGFVFVVHTPAHGSDCVASAMTDTLCPKSALDFALYHISAYNAFSNVPIQASFASLLLFVFSFLLFFTLAIYFGREKETVPKIFRFLERNFEAGKTLKKKILHWLSLFELSPSF